MKEHIEKHLQRYSQPLKLMYCLVEDDSDDRGFIVEMFKRRGFDNIVTFSSAKAAIAQIDDKWHFVITDDDLKNGLFGIDLLKEVKKKSPKSKRIVITQNNSYRRLQKYVNEVGICGWIDKGDVIDWVDQLEAKIDELVPELKEEFSIMNELVSDLHELKSKRSTPT